MSADEKSRRLLLRFGALRFNSDYACWVVLLLSSADFFFNIISYKLFKNICQNTIRMSRLSADDKSRR